MGDGEVSIKSLDIILILIESIAVEYLHNLMASDSAGHIDLEIHLKGVEITGGNNDFLLPVAVGRIIIFLVDRDGRK